MGVQERLCAFLGIGLGLRLGFGVRIRVEVRFGAHARTRLCTLSRYLPYPAIACQGEGYMSVWNGEALEMQRDKPMVLITKKKKIAGVPMVSGSE